MKWFKRIACVVLFLAGLLLLLNLSAGWVIHRALENGLLQSWVSESLGDEIHYDVVNVDWTRGNASIRLNQVQVVHGNQTILNIPQLELHVDTLSSLWHFKLIFNQIDVEGLVLQFKKTDTGMHMTQSDQNHIAWREVWSWIAAQKKILIQNATLLSDEGKVLLQQFDLDCHQTLRGQIKITSRWRFQDQAAFFKFSGLLTSADVPPIGDFYLEIPETSVLVNQESWAVSGHAHLAMKDQEQLSQVRIKLIQVGPGVWDRAQSGREFNGQWDARWQFDEHQLRAQSNRLLIADRQLQMQVVVDGSWFMDEREWANPSLDLKGYVKAQHLQEFLFLCQTLHPLNPQLFDWLFNNVKAVPAVEASLAWKGRLLDYPTGALQENATSFFTLDADVKEIDFTPDQGFPVVEKVNTTLHIVNDHLNLKASQVHSAGLIGDEVSFELKNWVDDLAVMEAHIKTDSTAFFAQAYLLQTPLVHNFPWLKYITLNGQIHADLNINIPIDERPITVTGYVDLLDNQVWPGAQHELMAQEIKGRFYLAGDHFYTEHPITGYWLGYALQANFEKNNLPPTVINQVKISGVLPTQAFWQGLFGRSFSHLFQGEAPFQGSWVQQRDTWSFETQFDLSKVVAIFPEPYAPYSFQEPLKIEARALSPDHVHITSGLAEILKADLMIDLSKDFVKPVGSINILTQKIEVSDQLQVSMHLPIWTDASLIWLFKQLEGSSATYDFLKFNLELDQVRLYGQSYDHFFLDFDPMNHGSMLSFYHDAIAAQIFIPEQIEQPLQIHMKRLYWVAEGKISDFEIEPSFVPTLIPAMNLEIEDLKLNTRPLGRVVLETKKQKDGVLIQELKWTHPAFEAVLTGDWVNSSRLAEPSMLGVSGQISSGAWDEFFRALGFEKPLLTAKAGRVDFALTWPGAPYAFDRKKASGSIFFDLSRGALMGVNPAIARFVDVMNIASLNRRLQLSGSGLKGDDLIFDRFSGQYELESGILKSHNANLIGPTLDMTLIGEIDLNHKVVHKKIRVKPHLGSSMAVVAGVIGGPVVGAAAWIADRVVGQTLLKDKAVMYRLDGPWDRYDLVPLQAGE